MDTLQSFGLWLDKALVTPMNAPHRHHELELNLLFTGSVQYLFGGRIVRVSAGQGLVFWGALPHRLTDFEPDTVCGWLCLPLATLLRFGITPLQGRLLQGNPVAFQATDLEFETFDRWLEVGNDSPHGSNKQAATERQKIVELEVEAFLRRLALNLPLNTEPSQPADSKAAQLAQYISEHYLDALSIQKVASAVHLSEAYAATLFKNTFAMTLLDYLTQHRITHAQRLLVTTKLPILDVAFESGFGSSSQFYACFKRYCGQSPNAYRNTLPLS